MFPGREAGPSRRDIREANYKQVFVLKIKNILVSQPTPVVAEKSPYHEIVLRHKVNVEFRPFIKQEGVSLKEFRSQRVDILAHTAVIFTSRVTIDNFFRICEEARIAIPETMKYFCNTEAIALYLQKYIVYRKRKIFFADGTFSSLIELILKHKDEKFLLTLSEPHKPEMPLAMEKLKLQSDKVILARTVSAELDDVDIHKYDLLVFYSPSEIASLTEKFTLGENAPKIATFGHGTVRAAIGGGLDVHVMAPTPEVPSMTKAIDIYIRKVNAGEEVSPVAFDEQPSDLDFIENSKHGKGKRRATTVKSDTASAANVSSSAKKSAAKTATSTAKSVGK